MELLQKNIKDRREVLASYILIRHNSWRRIYPETFYELNSFIDDRELKYIGLIYEIFQVAIDGCKRTLIEDEINLIYAEIESRLASEGLSEVVIPAIQERLDLKKRTLQEIEDLSIKAESLLLNLAQTAPHIRFRLESTTYLVRLLAYGLFSDNKIIFDRIAEVFDVGKLQSATKPKDKHSMDDALKFLYKGLIQKNESGRQGSRHAARQTLAMLKEWYHDNEYVISCIDKIGRYFKP